MLHKIITVITCLLLISNLLTISANAQEKEQQAWVVTGAQINQASNDDFVNLKELIPDIEVELKYATNDNITGRKIYDFNQAHLRKGTALKLQKTEDEAEKHGYRIKIWDAYRPPEAQFKLWEACPNPNYIADPNRTFSVHSRGAAVDVTLADADGNDIGMPSKFDDATIRAGRNYSNDPPALAANARLLESIMYQNGFKGLPTEWWHFEDAQAHYPVARLNLLKTINIVIGATSDQTAVYNVNGRILAPVRFLAGILGVEVQWDPDNFKAILRRNGIIVCLKPDNNLVVANGKQIFLDAVPLVIGGVMFIPVRLFSLAFLYNISWNNTTQTLIINDEGPPSGQDDHQIAGTLPEGGEFFILSAGVKIDGRYRGESRLQPIPDRPAILPDNSHIEAGIVLRVRKDGPEN